MDVTSFRAFSRCLRAGFREVEDPALLDLLAKAYYAMQDTRAPLVVNLGVLGGNFILNLVLLELFPSPGALAVGAALAMSAGVNTGERSNGAPTGKPGHIPNLRHELRPKGIPHSAHLHDNRILRKLRGQFQHLRFQLLHSLGYGVEGVNGLPDQPLGQIILGHYGDLFFRTSMNLSGLIAAEVIAVPLTPFAVALRECGQAHTPYAVHMPEGRNKIHPFLRPILADRAVKEGVHTGIGLVQKSDEVVFHHCLCFGIQITLPVQRFQLVTNCIHGSILPQFHPVVKAIFRNFLGISLVGLDLTQRVISIILDEFRVHCTDV